jgi:hypothetical protein
VFWGSPAVVRRLLLMTIAGTRSLEMNGTLFPNGKNKGIFHAPNAIWYGRIIAMMAGAEAVTVLLGKPKELGDDGDRREIWEMMDRLTGGPDVQEVVPDYPKKVWAYSDGLGQRRNTLEKRLRAMTCMLVRRHRHRIEAVARALLDRKSMSSDELDLLMQSST